MLRIQLKKLIRSRKYEELNLILLFMIALNIIVSTKYTKKNLGNLGICFISMILNSQNHILIVNKILNFKISLIPEIHKKLIFITRWTVRFRQIVSDYLYKSLEFNCPRL